MARERHRRRSPLRAAAPVLLLAASIAASGCSGCSCACATSEGTGAATSASGTGAGGAGPMCAAMDIALGCEGGSGGAGASAGSGGDGGAGVGANGGSAGAGPSAGGSGGAAGASGGGGVAGVGAAGGSSAGAGGAGGGVAGCGVVNAQQIACGAAITAGTIAGSDDGGGHLLVTSGEAVVLMGFDAKGRGAIEGGGGATTSARLFEDGAAHASAVLLGAGQTVYQYASWQAAGGLPTLESIGPAGGTTEADAVAGAAFDGAGHVVGLLRSDAMLQFVRATRAPQGGWILASIGAPDPANRLGSGSLALAADGTPFIAWTLGDSVRLQRGDDPAADLFAGLTVALDETSLALAGDDEDPVIGGRASTSDGGTVLVHDGDGATLALPVAGLSTACSPPACPACDGFVCHERGVAVPPQGLRLLRTDSGEVVVVYVGVHFDRRRAFTADTSNGCACTEDATTDFSAFDVAVERLERGATPKLAPWWRATLAQVLGSGLDTKAFAGALDATAVGGKLQIAVRTPDGKVVRVLALAP